MCRAIFTACVIFTILGSLNSEISQDNSCMHVKDDFLKISSQDLVPDVPTIDEGLQVCSKSLTARQASCCSRDSEMKYVLASEQYLMENIHSKNAYLKTLISEHMKDYQDKVLALAQHAQNITNTKTTDWYSVPWEEHRVAIAKFFTDIEEFVRLKNVIIKNSVSTFFDDIFPVIFKNVIYRQSAESWTHHYHHCLTQHRQQITPNPFGNYPEEVANKLNRGLSLGRAYLEALEIVTETINTTDNLMLENDCKHAVTRMQYCSHCRGFVGIKPCKGYCLDVMRGCLSKIAEIGPEWNDIISSVEGLVREMSEKNMDEVFKDLVVGISDAFMHAMVAAPDYYQSAHDLCGIPLDASDSVTPARTPNFTRNQGLTPVVTGPLSMDVMKVTLDLVDSKSLYMNLADDICAESTHFEQDPLSGSCWNGTEVSVYLRDAVDMDILSQARNNQEVKVSLILDPSMRKLKDKMAIVNLKLQSHSGKTDRHRPKTYMISDDPEVYEHSGEGNPIGNVITGAGTTLNDDEDLYNNFDVSGSGSGDREDPVDYPIETGKNIDVVIDGGKPNLRPYEEHEGGTLNNRPNKPPPPREQTGDGTKGTSSHIQVSISLVLSTFILCIYNIRR